MTIENYLKVYIEGYLFKDIKSIQKGVPVPLPPGEDFGAVGYPIIMSCLAGMEMLGYLLMSDGKGFDTGAGKRYFLNYWDNYFSKVNPTYKDLGGLFYVLLRHGLAHAFLSKHGVWVTRGRHEDTKVNTQSKSISLDADVFFEEFKKSYLDIAKPNASSVRAQTQLDDFLVKSQAQSDEEFEKLNKKGIARNDVTYDMQAYGASGPGPTISAALASASGPHFASGMVTVVQASGVGSAPVQPIFPIAPKGIEIKIEIKKDKDSVREDI